MQEMRGGAGEHMRHLGDICKINGAEIEPVDVITGGSPCQDLSVAGKRAGLQGERSGLFMEQVRIIREMRQATNGVYPRIMVWENVPGAFSSNKGEDFRAVLEETAKIADETAVIPRPPDKWTTAGCIMGDQWSIAWRVLDAQFWGVPQRRRRIALVADFGGQSAPEILFKSDSVSGHFAESGTEREGVAADAERGVGTTSGSLSPFLPQTARIYDADGKWPTLQANSNGGQNRQAVFYPDVARSLTARHDSSPCIDRGQNIVAFTQNQRDEVRDLGDKAGALAAEPGMKQQTYVAGFCQGASPAAQTIGYQEAVCYPINDKATRYKGGGSTRNKDGSGNGLGVGKNGDPAPTLTSGDKHGVAVLPFDTTNCIDTTNPDPSKNQGGMAVVCMATQQGGAEIADNLCPTITASAGMSGNNQPVVAVVHGLVSKGNGESFLMPEKHMSLSTGGGQAGQGYPAIYDARGNGDGKKQYVFENHSQDTRYVGPLDVAPIVSATFGMGGNNQPFVVKELDTSSFQRSDELKESQVASTQSARQYKSPTDMVAAVDCRNGTEEVNDGIKALQILRKDYGDTNVLEWAKRVQKSIQKTDLLRQRVHESGISEQTENGNELDDDTLPRPELVAEWLMRDVRGHQEHRCSSQRRKPSKQPYNEPTKIVQELPQQTAQTSKELFNMWKSGQGLWILREALSAVQKMGKSICVQGEPTHARNSVRRLTPLEAERLQGFPDNWTNIPPQTDVTEEDLTFWRTVWDEWDDMNGKKRHSDKQIIKWLQSEPADSARYKALGNSIALPPWRFVLSRIRQTGSKTLGSLFDGIGGFPLIWQELGGQAVWASEIEPFPIAVTKARIG